MKMAHGFAFPDADELMAREIQPDGTYQRTHLERALTYVTDRSIAIDGGAHVGTFSRTMSQHFTQVIAVEPSADTYAALCMNMRAFACLNVTCLGAALGSAPGFVSMRCDARELARGNTGARHVEPGGTISVERIDDWRIPSLGLLKLDVEGSEVAALEGAAATLTRCRPIVLFEDKGLWARYGAAPDAPQRLLTALQYRHLETVGSDAIWGPRP